MHPSNSKIRITKAPTKTWLKGSLLLSVGLSTLALAQTAVAQDAAPDEVIVTGIRQSLENALVEKREADSLVEVIFAEDIGKLVQRVLVQAYRFVALGRTLFNLTVLPLLAQEMDAAVSTLRMLIQRSLPVLKSSRHLRPIILKVLLAVRLT